MHTPMVLSSCFYSSNKAFYLPSFLQFPIQAEVISLSNSRAFSAQMSGKEKVPSYPTRLTVLNRSRPMVITWLKWCLSIICTQKYQKFHQPAFIHDGKQYLPSNHTQANKTEWKGHQNQNPTNQPNLQQAIRKYLLTFALNNNVMSFEIDGVFLK